MLACLVQPGAETWPMFGHLPSYTSRCPPYLSSTMRKWYECGISRHIQHNRTNENARDAVDDREGVTYVSDYIYCKEVTYRVYSVCPYLTRLS